MLSVLQIYLYIYTYIYAIYIICFNIRMHNTHYKSPQTPLVLRPTIQLTISNHTFPNVTFAVSVSGFRQQKVSVSCAYRDAPKNAHTHTLIRTHIDTRDCLNCHRCNQAHKSFPVPALIPHRTEPHIYTHTHCVRTVIVNYWCGFH